MIGLLSLSVGLGLVVSLLFTELFGLAVGGMIVPGYLALALTRPWDVLLTVGAGFVTFVVVHSLGSVLIIYGRRRTVFMILVGYLMGMLVRWGAHGAVEGAEAEVVGFIIPGLIAIWFDRQGVWETVLSLVTAAAVVRLVLIVCVGSELLS